MTWKRLLRRTDDHVIVSVRVWLPSSETLRARLDAVAIRFVGRGETMGVDVSPQISFDAATGGERQDRFESALNSHLDALDHAGIDERFISENGGQVLIYVTLSPGSGQAGVVFPPETLRRCAGLNTLLTVDAF